MFTSVFHSSPPVDTVLIQLNAVCIPAPCYFKSHFAVFILSSAPIYAKRSVCLRFYGAFYVSFL